MAIEDSNPERRNLVVLSMAIIAFYVGGCEIPSTGEIELPLIKLKFTDAYHLAWLVWLMLVWFAFRYWVETYEKSRAQYRKEMNGRSDLQWLTKFLYLREFKSKEIKSGSITYYINGSVLQINYEVTNNKGHTYNSAQISSRGIKRAILQVAVTAKVFLDSPGLSANYFPLCFFVVAVGFGLNGASAKKPVENYYLDINKFLVQAGESSNELKSAICE